MTDPTFDAKDHLEHPDFLTPHALFCDKTRNIFWAALLRPTGVAVYLALLNHAHYQKRDCFPAESTLAKETGLNIRQVKREIKKLIAFGMITKTTPRQKKKDLFSLPEREHHTNTYTILEKTQWRIPAEYAQPKARADKGIRRKKTAQLELGSSDSQSPSPTITPPFVGSDSQSPAEVTDSHQGGDSQSPTEGTDSHLDSDSQSRGRGLTVTQNNHKEITPGNNPNINNNTSGSVPRTTDVADDVDVINTILSHANRQERITRPLLNQIARRHSLISSIEVVQAVRALAPERNIRSVLAVIKGKKNGDSYESGCFENGRCYLHVPEDNTPAPPHSEWEQVCAYLEQRLSRSDFNAWKRFCSLRPTNNGHVEIEVKAPELTIKTMLEERAQVVRNAFAAVRGGVSPTIQFLVAEQAAP